MPSLKRHRSLVPLSHDHHQGLIAAQRLKRGRSAFDEVEDAARSIEALWERELAEHFRQEEEIIFAAARGCGFDPLIDRAIGEHAEFRRMLAMCGAGDCDVRAFGALLEAHIRFEERELFPLIQSALAGDRLERLGDSLAQHREENPIVYRACSIERESSDRKA
jgi:iron-sulfur cluster repair protein YtfE (RIC family)